MATLKELPRGTWLTLRCLPKDTTEQDIQSWLAFCGIDLPLDNIAISNTTHTRFEQAIVCLDKEVIAKLFRRATSETELNGVFVDEIVYNGRN